MKIETCRFVAFAEIASPRVMEEFGESNPPYSWGDNNRTLIDTESIRATLDGLFDDDDPDLVETLRKLEELPEDVYIDLEN